MGTRVLCGGSKGLGTHWGKKLGVSGVGMEEGEGEQIGVHSQVDPRSGSPASPITQDIHLTISPHPRNTSSSSLRPQGSKDSPEPPKSSLTQGEVWNVPPWITDQLVSLRHALSLLCLPVPAPSREHWQRETGMARGHPTPRTREKHCVQQENKPSPQSSTSKQ